LTSACIAALARPAWAAPADVQANRGLAFAKRGDCVKAVPLLEEAELKRHRPHTALALADCYVALGELLRASELYHATAAEKPARTFTWYDRLAIKRAKKKAENVDKRIPTIAFAAEEDYEDLEIEIDGREVTDPEQPRKAPPDVTLTITARAKGYEDMTEELVLNEGERRVLEIRLTPLPAPRKNPTKRPPRPAKRGGRPTTWLGGGYQGFVVPQFLFGMFGEGGRTMLAPGAELTLTVRASDVDLAFSLAYASFRVGETPFKPSGSPDTDWEILESDLQALIAAAHLAWDIPLNDAGTVAFRVGGGIGVGWTFLGDLYRTQSYPPEGAGDDPYLWQKCQGPNDPAGTYLYCNQLDHDADHYFGYVEPSWFEGGRRPLLFPWLALPELGLAFHPSRTFAIDVQIGLSLTGILTGLGVRFGL
jgi:tetratricopeptide (TPR) repeat protein